MFTAQYGLMPYINQIMFHLLKVNYSLYSKGCVRLYNNIHSINPLPLLFKAARAERLRFFQQAFNLYTTTRAL
jgi:hypothetical protein